MRTQPLAAADLTAHDDRDTDDDRDPAPARGYENAPACALLATHCAACGRPLLDADSVTAGMGPDCRGRYGCAADGPDGPTDAARLAAISEAGQLELNPRSEMRQLANQLIHRVGRAPDSTDAAHAICALWALGYRKVATKLVRRAGVTVETVDNRLLVRAPYHPLFAHRLRAANTWATWNKTEKAWFAPAANRKAVWKALLQTYPGRAVLGPSGCSFLPEADG